MSFISETKINQSIEQCKIAYVGVEVLVIIYWIIKSARSLLITSGCSI
ncbi:Uncharacterised protein [Legionella cherrii]|uniref:Uncharacterized protein n=1 Tax=Legionella cherrii TaxID=28084 RepID=A0ABY6TAR9_9GAMM|nr:Uncharacterised protein [Legionella cherrii]